MLSVSDFCLRGGGADGEFNMGENNLLPSSGSQGKQWRFVWVNWRYGILKSLNRSLPDRKRSCEGWGVGRGSGAEHRGIFILLIQKPGN